ncbi:hypothetical protein MAMC_01833 [Methylacidimicrobium cyclopophantes]|uniref:Uncharacterized protein n=1 Tax=Methylacidimicrobium cyclopophantes TaxID=1041766 RepID=A0A5E6MFB7_9BACT|nr:hypothetical protein [Methylacidimicrobium cyclopophantes]VVM07806.1 hypothetical protein MAMC_01833 [Methylacidimicrobium cyclopophantes]
MALNRKLSPILHGRKIARSEAAPTQLTLSFTDGSQLQVRLGSTPPEIPAEAVIEKVLESGSRFVLVFAAGSSLELVLADPGASVCLRDGQGRVEYLG